MKKIITKTSFFGAALALAALVATSLASAQDVYNLSGL